MQVNAVLLCFFKGDGQITSANIRLRTFDKDSGSCGGRAWKNKRSRDCGHTEVITGRNIYIFIYIFLFRSFSQKEKKSELKMLQYFPSERTDGPV